MAAEHTAPARQYLAYVDEIRSRNLELTAESLLMAAMLIGVTQAEAYAPIYRRLAFASSAG